MKQTITSSLGSIPKEIDHAKCKQVVRSDFFLCPVPESVKLHTSRIWGGIIASRVELSYSTEADIVGFVKIFLEDLIVAMGLSFTLVNNMGFNHIAPDICVVTDGQRLVGVIEVKKRGPGILIEPTVLGELFDQMLLVEGFYCSGPVLGILTSLEEWVFAWFEADNPHFASFSQQSKSLSSFLTPSKAVVGAGSSFRYSPLGNTPSQQSGKTHAVDVDDVDEKEESLRPYDDRTLSSTIVFNSQADFQAILQHLYTAFRRMDEVHLHHTIGVPCCLFLLHKGRMGITWHAVDGIHIDIKDLSAINTFPRNNVQHLLAVEDLGRGGSGKVWLTCTLSKKPSICVLKFHNYDGTGSKLLEEKNIWDAVYPDFEMLTSVDMWSGSFALKMPHFSAIPVDDRDSLKTPILEMMRKTFQDRGFVHLDVRWRNIGYIVKDGKMHPLLYDLESVRKYSEEQDSQWIEKAMIQLYEI